MRILAIIIISILPFSMCLATDGKLAPKSSLEIEISVVVPEKISIKDNAITRSRDGLCFSGPRDFESVEIISNCDGESRKEDISFLKDTDNFCLNKQIEINKDCTSQLIINPL